MDPKTAAILSRFKSPLASKWMLAEITRADDTVAQKSGREQVAVQLAPVVNNYPVGDLTARAYIQRAMEGDPPDALAQIRKRGAPFVRAVDPEFPELPHREGAGVYTVKTSMTCTDPVSGEEVSFSEGQSIGFSEYNIIRTHIDALTFDALQTLGDKTEDLVGTRLWIKPGKATYSEQYGVSQFINDYALDLPAGQESAGDDVIDRARQQELLAELGINVEV